MIICNHSSEAYNLPQKNDTYFYFLSRHNDLPWNIRKFIHNKLNTVNFTSNLKTENPWGTSPWSHTDLTRLVNGHVGGQVRYQVVLCQCFQWPTFLFWNWIWIHISIFEFHTPTVLHIISFLAMGCIRSLWVPTQRCRPSYSRTNRPYQEICQPIPQSS